MQRRDPSRSRSGRHHADPASAAWVDNAFQSMGFLAKTDTGSKYQDDTQHVVLIPKLAFNGYTIFFLIRYTYIH